MATNPASALTAAQTSRLVSVAQRPRSTASVRPERGAFPAIEPYIETLALGDRLSAAYLSISDALPYFGRVSFHDEHAFKAVKNALEFIGQGAYSQVLMPNPYGNNRRLAIYEALREIGFPVITFDRGALPDSWFFDTGFNADSMTYHPLNWDRELSEEARARALDYILHFRATERMLEDQGPRLSLQDTRELLGGCNKKLLLVPLQRPKDTTITHFSNLKHGITDFIAILEDVADLIESEGLPWRVVVKQHPLETNPVTSNKFFVCPPACHIQSLVEASDMVLLVNSGVGVNGMLWGKPVLHVGRIFYGHPALNRPVRDATDVNYYLNNPFVVDDDKAMRFVFHLIDRVYSFGSVASEIRIEDDGALRRVARRIEFRRLQLPIRKKKCCL